MGSPVLKQMCVGQHLGHIFGKLRAGRCHCKILSVCGIPEEGPSEVNQSMV